MRQLGDILNPLRALALLALFGLLGGFGALAYYLPQAMQASAMDAALKANLETIDQVKRVRGFYTQAVVARALKTGALKPGWDWRDRANGIPLPATLVKELSDLMTGPDSTLSLVSPYPWPHRAGRKMDAFEKEAWRIFQADPGRVVAREDMVSGRRVLRVAVADRMTAQACVDCHNADPLSARRDWKVGDVRAVFESTSVVEPYLRAADERSSFILTILAGAATIGAAAIMLLLFFFERRDGQKRAADKAAYHMAEHDALTGLKNRARFNAALAACFSDRKGPRFGALFLIDLDQFKPINDTYGHGAGDELLIAVANRLRAVAGPRDLVARLGGDEFALLRAGSAPTPEKLARMAEDICRKLGEPFSIEGKALAIGACVGVAIPGRDASDPSGLMVAADLALYAAKAGGRAQWRGFEPVMMTTTLRRTQLAMELREAFDARALALHYQPIVAANSGEVVSVEALLRWRREDGSYVPPLEFIPIAEEDGLIVPIGAWVLQTACADMAAFDRTTRVSVNLSPRQIERESIVDDVRMALRDSGLDPGRLELEITESTLLREDQHTLTTLNALRALGVGIAIDDFGTGYSCLSYLQSYPITCVKIDRSFIVPLGEAPAAGSLVQAIIALAQALGMRTVAEGVETAEQRRALAALGCDALQGYHFARPGPLQTAGEAGASGSSRSAA